MEPEGSLPCSQKLIFYDKELLTPRQTPKMEDYYFINVMRKSGVFRSA
jgi:hypothetical protein